MVEKKMESNFKFYAFISYSHKNPQWAEWLQRRIETYKLPTVSRKEDSNLPKRVKPVFLDTTDLNVERSLDDALREKLRQSQYLIVICSPQVVNSTYVGDEISYFIDNGRADRIIPVIIDGIPNSADPSQECFHPVLRQRLPDIFGISVSELGKELAYLKVIAKLLNLDLDTFVKRHNQRKVRQRILMSALALLVAAMLVAVRAYTLPFNAQLTLDETSFHNENLGFPTKEGEITIIYNNDKDTLIRKIKSLNDTIIFNNIPGDCRNRDFRLFFELHGFFDIDSIMKLSSKIALPIRRDEEIYGEIIGHVRDSKTDQFLGGATVKIAGEETVTDSAGYFKIDIPIERQDISYEAAVVFNVKEKKKQKAYPKEKDGINKNTLSVEEK
jgi:hypothetical protein